MVLARPPGAPSLQEIIIAASNPSAEGESHTLEQWHKLGGFSQEGQAEWEPLGRQPAADLKESLAQFARLACCDYLCPRMDPPSDWNSNGAAAPGDGQRGLVLLDAQGGPVSVLQQSWKEMMQQKLRQ